MRNSVFLASPVMLTALLGLLGLFQGGCGGTTAGNPAVEDFSVSGAAASAVGGALSGSSPNATQAHQVVSSRSSRATLPLSAGFRALLSPWPEALASTTCPTYKSDSAEGCSSDADTQWLELDDCQYGASATTWSGTIATIVSPALSASCGAFPRLTPPGYLYRQYVTAPGSTTPGSVQITSSFGTVSTVDNKMTSGTLYNFAGDAITTIINNGYGTSTHFNSSGVRDQLTLAHRLTKGGSLDLTISGQLGITEDSTGTSGSQTVSGSIRVYHNYLRLIATSTFENVIHQNTCCLPVSGTISTTFSSDSSVAPTSAGSKEIGKTETLTLTGCGTGTLQNYDGTSNSVVLTHCF